MERTKGDYASEARSFEELPYKQPPYDSRNWGHGLHSLCSYQGKLKPAIAHFLVKNFSAAGETVLDPMSGSGSIPLEAFLQGRRALGNDLQELGFILTRAKVEKGTDEEVNIAINNLLDYVEENKGSMDPKAYSDFGFNGKMPEYFNEETYREVLAARTYLISNPCESWAQATVYASLLHILHGNRPYALSRNSHPVTPFAPTGGFEYRPLAPRLKGKVFRSIALPTLDDPIKGIATRQSFDHLPYESEIDVIITSPPFAGSTRFFIANWMRLWMAGWEPGDFTSKRDDFLEYRQKKSFDVYKDFFEHCARWLKPNGRLIMHTGKTKSQDMAEELTARSGGYFKFCHSFDESVVGREKFGIRDQGATLSHQYIFFEKR
jgi:DNA modification methylase